jgi:hypothetical protein
MLPSMLNLTSTNIHFNKKKQHLKSQKISSTDYGINNNDDSSNYSQRRNNTLIVDEKTTNEKEKTEFEFRLPKIIINNSKINTEKNSILSDTTTKSIENNHFKSTPDLENYEYCDSNYIDYSKYNVLNYQYYNSLIDSMANIDKKNKNINLITFESESENFKRAAKLHVRKVRRKAKSQATVATSPESFSSKKEWLQQPSDLNLNPNKVSYNNLRLTCKDQSKKKNQSNPFQTKLKPLTKNSFYRGFQSVPKEYQSTGNYRGGDSDVEFYLSSQNNAFNQRNISNNDQSFNAKLKNYLNYRKTMFFKFNSHQSIDFDALYNSYKSNFIKNSKSINDDKLHNKNFPLVSSEYPTKASQNTSSNDNNKYQKHNNMKNQNDFISNSYFSLKLPKLIEESNKNHINGILASTNNFQIQHDKINNLTKELKSEIDKIVFHYPSINTKRSNGKLVKIKTIMNTNLTKYEHKIENTDDKNERVIDPQQLSTTNFSELF